ncbi:MAG: hypoxanthine phosphoribosyltransferase [Planctomycetota bacterium]|jgi:hypoxanthine phosphoribosyltransferase
MESPAKVTHDISEVIVARERIEPRVAELAGEITDAFGQAELTIVAVLEGALVFLADLMGHLTMPVRLVTVRVSSYRGATTTPGPVHLDRDFAERLTGRRVLIVDDILDTGRTLATVLDHVRSQQPAECRTCVLLRKRRKSGQDAAVPLDFIGFDVPDVFVVGYGLDYDGRYRNLPDIVALRTAREERT